MQLGTIYEISNFFITNNKQKYKIVPHAAMLQFARSTVFKNVEEDIPEIPQHKFNFVEFDQLTSKIDINDILSDVIGRVISIKGIEESTINDRMVKRRGFVIQNIREETLNVTLWGEIGDNIDENSLQTMPEPVVIAFSAMAAKQYMGGLYVASTSGTSFYIDPDIPETKKIKKRFSHSIQGIDFIAGSTKKPLPLEEQKTINRTTIIELQALNPYQNQETKFTVKAIITELHIHQGWFYNACPRCYRQIKQSGTSWWCDNHGHLTTMPISWYKINARIEDSTGGMNIVMFGKTVQSLINKPCSILTIQEGYTDPAVIPPILNQLKGMSKIFVIQFRPRGAFIDAVVIKSFDDDVQPLSLPAPTIIPSTETISSVTSFDPETPQVEGKKTAKRQLTFTKPVSGEEKPRSEEKLKKIKHE
ncbi:hypothetical protein TIFTF001_041055 [Ficus carica]|uniref:Replication factor A C-terminal domain-containing protein n=1 Tax=Ficus carica TaxID=3494 RepID=A0AA87Z7X6_FICCA|nr:hypothetical protein TIFTF001_041055 [Ficus carica]